MKEGFEMPRRRAEREPETDAAAGMPGMSRRAFMRGMLANAVAAAVAASKADQLAAAPGYEQTPLTRDDERFFRTLLEDPAALARFREAPTSEQAISMVRVLARSDIGWLERLRVSDKMHPGALTLTDRAGRFVGNGTRVRVRAGTVAGGLPVYRYFILTATHVADIASAPGAAWVRHPDGYDVAVSEDDQPIIPRRNVGTDRETVDAFDFDMRHRPDRMMDGLSGIVLARNERYQPQWQRRAHASRISPVLGQPFYAALKINDDTPYRQKDFRIIVLPPGQGKLDTNSKMTPSNGDSGSPFLVERPGTLSLEIGGIISEVAEQTIPDTDASGEVIGGVTYSLGQIVDRERIREVIRHALEGPSGAERFAGPKELSPWKTEGRAASRDARARQTRGRQ